MQPRGSQSRAMVLKMADSNLSEIVRLIKLTGHYFNFDEHSRPALLFTLQRLRILYMVVVNPFSLFSLFVGGLEKAMGLELFFGLMGLLTAVQHVYMYRKRKDIEELIRNMREIRRKFQAGSDDDLKEDTVFVWKVVRFYLFNMAALVIFYITLPKLVDYVYGLIWDDPIAYRFPNVMDGFLDENQHRNMKYVMVTVFSISWSAISTYSHFGLDALLLLICFYYASMVKTFRKSLTINADLTSEQKTRLVKSFAAHHRALHTLSLQIKFLFGFPYALQNTVGSFCIVSLLYAMLSGNSGGSIVLAVNYFNFLLLLGMLTSTAYVGQTFTNVSSTIFDAIYDIPWYELCPSDRKYFISMLQASREPATINFLGRTPLNLSTYMGILNTAYSYFMCMRSMLK